MAKMANVGFLQRVAEDLREVFGGDYSDLTVVFPNKRASLFMNDCLAASGDGRPMWTPEYVTISDIFSRLSDLMVADPLYLVCRLHEVYCQVTGSRETLDRFYAWGELLLSDFDDIDNNLVDAEKLFANIADLDDLTGYDYMTEEQRRAIHQFFTSFRRDEKTELKERFQSVWKCLFSVYTEFRRVLLCERKAYGGMLKRQVTEQLKQCPEECARRLDTRCFAIVGFNVLNETEKQLFRFLGMERETLFYWDYDDAYIDYEAGTFINENKRLFPNRFAGRGYYDNFRTDKEKHITFVSSPTEDAQSRYIAQWLQSADVSIDNRTAIVLCNEKILNSVLHSIPPMVEGESVLLNVTMGFPLTDTPVFSFLSVLLDLQTHGRTTSGRWRYSHVAAVLRHPYTEWLSEGASTELLALLNKKSILFPDDELLRENETLADIFIPCGEAAELPAYLTKLIERLGTMASDHPLFAESVYQAHALVCRIRSIQETLPGFKVSKDTFCRLLKQLLRSKTIPFHGEPAVGLQIMGLLETRNLDFDNVLMLSVNEGQLPRVSMNNTFIPYTLRSLHGMTTIEKQTSLYAYYFYRLLQRARNITLMYNSSTEGLNRGEMSRFMMQLQIEADRLFAPNVQIELKTLVAGSGILPNVPLDVAKGPDVLERLHRRFDLAYEAAYSAAHNGAKMTLSPSAINDYLDCRRRFYLKYVMGLKVDDELTDDVDDAMFGTLLHDCMERIYRPCVGRQVQSQYLLNLADDPEKIAALVDEAFAVNVFKTVPQARNLPYNGHQLLNRHVLITYVRRQLRFDALSCPFTLLGVERPAYSVLKVPSAEGDFSVRIGGIIDRYEQINDAVQTGLPGQDRIRVVDYKTSSTAQTATSLQQLFDPDAKKRSHHWLQAYYYCDVLTDTATLPVYPLLMYVKNAPSKRTFACLMDKEVITDFKSQLKAEYHERLQTVIQEIFTAENTFLPTENRDQCLFCDFKNVCPTQNVGSL